MAVENEGLAGYLSWWVVDRFRGSPRRGAYVPEWAHGALPGREARAYRALYRAAATEWTATGCRVHAITLLANDDEARDAWFWNGFGLAVVDAPGSTAALETGGSGFRVRRPPSRAEMLSELDAEHVRHYAGRRYSWRHHTRTRPTSSPSSSRAKNSVWLAVEGTDLPASCVSAAMISSGRRPPVGLGRFLQRRLCAGAYRGQRAGIAMLHSALGHYAARD